jgi:hypothetical protein
MRERLVCLPLPHVRAATTTATPSSCASPSCATATDRSRPRTRPPPRHPAARAATHHHPTNPSRKGRTLTEYPCADAGSTPRSKQRGEPRSNPPESADPCHNNQGVCRNITSQSAYATGRHSTSNRPPRSTARPWPSAR